MRIKRIWTMVITVAAIALVLSSCARTEPATVADWRDGSIVCLQANHGAALLDANFEVRAEAPDVSCGREIDTPSGSVNRLWNWSPDYTTALGGIEGQGAGVITLASGALQVCPEIPGFRSAGHLSLDGERDYGSAWYYLADGRIARTDGDDGSVYVIDGRCESPEWTRYDGKVVRAQRSTLRADGTPGEHVQVPLDAGGWLKRPVVVEAAGEFFGGEPAFESVAPDGTALLFNPVPRSFDMGDVDVYLGAGSCGIATSRRWVCVTQATAVGWSLHVMVLDRNYEVARHGPRLDWIGQTMGRLMERVIVNDAGDAIVQDWQGSKRDDTLQGAFWSVPLDPDEKRVQLSEPVNPPEMQNDTWMQVARSEPAK